MAHAGLRWALVDMDDVSFVSVKVQDLAGWCPEPAADKDKFCSGSHACVPKLEVVESEFINLYRQMMMGCTEEHATEEAHWQHEMDRFCEGLDKEHVEEDAWFLFLLEEFLADSAGGNSAPPVLAQPVTGHMMFEHLYQGMLLDLAEMDAAMEVHWQEEVDRVTTADAAEILELQKELNMPDELYRSMLSHYWEVDAVADTAADAHLQDEIDQVTAETDAWVASLLDGLSEVGAPEVKQDALVPSIWGAFTTSASVVAALEGDAATNERLHGGPTDGSNGDDFVTAYQWQSEADSVLAADDAWLPPVMEVIEKGPVEDL